LEKDLREMYESGEFDRI